MITLDFLTSGLLAMGVTVLVCFFASRRRS